MLINIINRLLILWNDVNYLVNFFEDNKEYLSSYIWNDILNAEDAANQVIEEAKELEELFDELYENTKNGNEPDFNSHFHPLDGKYKLILEWIPMKSYGTKSPSFLRLYAIKLNENTYIITGGGIKLSDTIQNSPDLKDHVIKNIDKVRTYLKEQYIFDVEDIEPY